MPTLRVSTQLSVPPARAGDPCFSGVVLKKPYRFFWKPTDPKGSRWELWNGTQFLGRVWAQSPSFTEAGASWVGSNGAKKQVWRWRHVKVDSMRHGAVWLLGALSEVMNAAPRSARRR